MIDQLFFSKWQSQLTDRSVLSHFINLEIGRYNIFHPNHSDSTEHKPDTKG